GATQLIAGLQSCNRVMNVRCPATVCTLPEADMHVRGLRCVRRLAPILTASLCLPLAGCFGFGPLPGRASDEWTKRYPLSAGGEVRIANINGRVEITGAGGSTVEVRALRIAHAPTDQAAGELLPRISIKEDIKPDRVFIETERLGGIMIGASF